MITIPLTDTTEIYGVSIRHMILRNKDVKYILIFLKSNYSYVLSKEVIKLLKLQYYVTPTRIVRLSNRDLSIRKIILNFDQRRKHSHKIMDYLDAKFKEEIEPDFTFCDQLIELRFGM